MKLRSTFFICGLQNVWSVNIQWTFVNLLYIHTIWNWCQSWSNRLWQVSLKIWSLFIMSNTKKHIQVSFTTLFSGPTTTSDRFTIIYLVDTFIHVYQSRRRSYCETDIWHDIYFLSFRSDEWDRLYRLLNIHIFVFPISLRIHELWLILSHQCSKRQKRSNNCLKKWHRVIYFHILAGAGRQPCKSWSRAFGAILKKIDRDNSIENVWFLAFFEENR